MKKVILVDDDPGIGDIAQQILEKEGYEVIIMIEGKYLLENEVTADVIILDRRLPDIDGIELCKELKSRATTRNIPIIMLSADPDIKMYSLNAGAAWVIEKPFTLKMLREVVARFV